MKNETHNTELSEAENEALQLAKDTVKNLKALDKLAKLNRQPAIGDGGIITRDVSKLGTVNYSINTEALLNAVRTQQTITL